VFNSSEMFDNLALT